MKGSDKKITQKYHILPLGYCVPFCCLLLLICAFTLFSLAFSHNTVALGNEYTIMPLNSKETGTTTVSVGYADHHPPFSPLSSTGEISTPYSLTGIPYRTLARQTLPTPIPTTPARTSLLPNITKKVIERPTINVPVFWFVLVIIFAIGSVAALVYFLVLRRDGAARKNDGKPAPSLHATILDTTVKSKNTEKTIGEMNNPGVHFPPSLEKKYNRPEFIGEGGLARVFRAYRTKDGTLVAVKVPIRFDEVTGTHFTKDILVWQNLHHRNIIEIYASNILPVPYIEMEYARSSLGDMKLPVDEEKAVALIQGVAAGLAYAHANGIVHRDIKPENILIAADGTPKITDWGLGKMMSDSRQSSVIGYSPAYAAPEQIAPQVYGRPGPWTDIYQIGILLYEVLTGSTPFEREGVHDINRAILYEKPPEPVWVGTRVQELGAIMMKCLKKNPKDRYDSVSSLIHALDQSS